LSNEIRKCIDCGEGYDAFVFQNGEIAGSGRCSSCKNKRLAEELAKIPNPLKTPLDTAKSGSAWTENTICKKCGVEYQAKFYNVLGMKYGSPRGLCLACDHVYLVDLAAKEKAEELRILNLKREEWRQESGIPYIYREKRFATWDFGRSGNVDAIRDICIEYAENYKILRPRENSSLIFTSPGKWGVGKTHLVSCIAHRVLDRWNGEDINRPVTMMTESDLFESIRATYNHKYEEGARMTEEKIINKATRTPLLILDDVGKEQVADPRFVQRTLFKIINGRYNYSLPVIITANKSAAELKTYFGGADGDEAILDRLLEMCKGKIHEVKGESYRRK
jgi:DNA replication protein DnaC